MKKVGLLCMCIAVYALMFAGCIEDESDDNDGTAEFELIGTWFAEDVEITTQDFSIVAEIETTFTSTSFEGTTTVTSEDPNQVTTNSGEIVSFSNSENWYVAKILHDSTNSDNIGKYGMTTYILSDDGLSFTGTSYSYEDTEEAAKASTVLVTQGETLSKQE